MGSAWSSRSSTRPHSERDPATLARDLTRMPRFRIAGIVAFDMFPQTAHVETVCELVPEAA